MPLPSLISIRVRLGTNGTDKAEALGTLFERKPGDTAVRLRLERPKDFSVILDVTARVRPDKEFRAEIERICGPECSKFWLTDTTMENQSAAAAMQAPIPIPHGNGCSSPDTRSVRTSLDYIQRLFTDFMELHGDRAFADDACDCRGNGLFRWPSGHGSGSAKRSRHETKAPSGTSGCRSPRGIARQCA